MKIYRVEYDDGRGPYNPFTEDELDYGECDPERDDMRFRLSEAHGWDDLTGRHPCPSFAMMPDCRCAFRSMRDLFAWFGGFLPQLTRIGARVVTYDINPGDVVYEDSFQLVYSTE